MAYVGIFEKNGIGFILDCEIPRRHVSEVYIYLKLV